MMGPVVYDVTRGENVMSDELVVDADVVDEPVAAIWRRDRTAGPLDGMGGVAVADLSWRT